jgi:hypothetical protein
MRKYIKSILSIAISFGIICGVTSCDTDVKPTRDISTASFWQTENDAWSYLNSIYRALTPDINVHGDSYTDDVYSQYSWESSGALFQQDALTAANGASWDFVGIRRVNDFLENVGTCDMNDNLRERMKAEARFLRAVNYLTKTIQLGKVPVITTVLEPSTVNIARDPVEEVRKFIIDELREVATILPDRYTGGYPNEKGRATRYAALAYLAKAALQFGQYDLAESMAKEVMDGPFSLFKITSLTEKQELEVKELELYVDFVSLGIDKDKFIKGLFSYESIWQKEYANPDNPEYIFAREYAENIQEIWVPYLALRPSQLGGWSSVTPTQSLVDAYWTADGKSPTPPTVAERKAAYSAIMADFQASNKTFVNFSADKVDDGTIKDYDYIKEFRNRDSRMYASIMFPFKGWFETNYGTNFYYQWFKTAGNESKTGYNFRKIVPYDRSAGGGDNGVADYPSVRFAEILLIYAEARTQNSGYDSQVQAALNQIRDRVGMPDVPATFATKQAALDFIRVERRIELSAEGVRANDLARYEDSYWQNAMNNVALTQPDGEVVITMKWSARMRLRPLPQTAIDRNPILANDQNPGY